MDQGLPLSPVHFALIFALKNRKISVFMQGLKDFKVFKIFEIFIKKNLNNLKPLKNSTMSRVQKKYIFNQV